MATSPPSSSAKSPSLAGAALLLGTGPVLLLFVAWLLFDWRHTLAVLAGLTAYISLAFGLARLARLPVMDVPPNPKHYLIAAVAGASAGVLYSFVVSGTLRGDSLLTGAFSGAGWVWVGTLVRAPFGARPWPPYRDDPGATGSGDTAPGASKRPN